ncbi:hypothetical protein ASPWEDRAFT_173751 [Aspergillus wentii DTO 134E9]|uniref:Uncharacterized protein n=1 Tax=Aspergillus wentii DTO 134E9 TaxID=1073089 RepID=A0A1L9RHB5_ASPWE|nr:uncharacterized protein ASPWEDRAFT_173751 [Aspergillus wentii DTO 134E9]OJJ34329.1 hypothetical protein ASPWEDRAFT_173751 [Aspergillus wentii DTO 134E9]
MQFSKALLVISAAFGPLALAAQEAAAPTTSTITLQIVNAHSSSFATPSPSSIPIYSSTPVASPSGGLRIPGPGRWNATSSSFSKVTTPAVAKGPSETTAAAASSSALVGAAPAVQYSGAMAAGVMAVAGLVML